VVFSWAELVVLQGKCLLPECNFIFSDEVVQFGQMLVQLGCNVLPLTLSFEFSQTKLQNIPCVTRIDAFQVDVIHVDVE